MIVDKINAYLADANRRPQHSGLIGAWAQTSFDRQFIDDRTDTVAIRLSSIGRCLRQQAYKLLGVPANGKEIDARAKMVFFQGDMAEMAIVSVAKLAGCKIESAGLNQRTISIDDVEGHPDGIFGEYLFECKSMSSYGFEEFQRGILDEGYRYQVNAYMYALNLRKAVIVALNKDAGVLHEMIIDRDESICEDIIGRIKRLKASTPNNLPPRPYHPNDKGFYPWQCLYCAYHKTCLPDAEKVLVGKAYKLKEKQKEKAA